jgi:hypothetical protein
MLTPSPYMGGERVGEQHLHRFTQRHPARCRCVWCSRCAKLERDMAHMVNARRNQYGVEVSSYCDVCGKGAQHTIEEVYCRATETLQDTVGNFAKVLDGKLSSQGCRCGGMTRLDRHALYERVVSALGY